MSGVRIPVKIRAVASIRFTRYSRLVGALAALAIFLLLAACSPEPGKQHDRAPQTAGPTETTSAGRTARTTAETGRVNVVVEQIAQGQQGPAQRQVVVAGSAETLSGATGVAVPDSGGGLYVSAQAGERPTGGYRVSISEAGDGEVRVELREPGDEDIVTQALTQPYAVALVRTGEGRVPEPGELSFVDAEGEPLGWPVRRVPAP